MIIRQTTTIVFEYPQDYLQEQEWCKTKGDEWMHVGTDTLGAVYENQISYSIGQPSNSEIPNNSTSSKMEQVEQRSCDTCKNRDIEGWKNPCLGCTGFAFYEPKDEPQYDAEEVAKDINRRVDMVKKEWNARHMDEPQTEPLHTCSVNGRPYSECSSCEHFKCTADEPQAERSER